MAGIEIILSRAPARSTNFTSFGGIRARISLVVIRPILNFKRSRVSRARARPGKPRGERLSRFFFFLFPFPRRVLARAETSTLKRRTRVLA